MRAFLAALVISTFLFLAPLSHASRQKRTERLLAVAHKQIGVPYLYGGATPRGFDCSGLVQWVFRKIGVRLPRTTWGQIRWGMRVRGRLRPGDVVFYDRGGHVALYVGDGRIEEAPHTGTRVQITTLRPFFEARRYL